MKIQDVVINLTLGAVYFVLFSVIFAEDKQGLSAHHFSVMAEQKPKWICPLCTYVNWPRSSRCTVCQSPRDLPSIEDEMERLEIIESRSNKLAGGGWSCPSCTYENWAASSRCTQCGTSAAGSTTISQLKVHSESSHPHSSFTMAQLTDVKWVCSVCTYQNWPSSKRCVMCQSAPVASHTTTETPSPISLEDAFISACKAVVLGHDHELQKLLLSTRKDIFTSRRLTGDECNALKQWFNCHHVSADESPFRQGANLVELASTCHRRELVSLFLALSPHTATPLSSSRGVLGTGCKRSLCMSSPSVAKELRLHLDSCVHQRKGEFGCSYLTEFGVFALPSEANEFPLNVQEILLNELCDSEVQTGKATSVGPWDFSQRSSSHLDCLQPLHLLLPASYPAIISFSLRTRNPEQGHQLVGSGRPTPRINKSFACPLEP